MKRLSIVIATVLVSSLCFIVQPAFAKDKTYTVTITNLTRGQVFSPPIVFSHNGAYELFMPGEPASDELYPLAEGGDTAPLIASLIASEDVWAYEVVGDPLGPVLPGNSVTFEIATRGKFDRISVASMLVGTNDAFIAVQDLKAKSKKPVSIAAIAYDAGSEANTEVCTDIPGPPCDNGENNRVDAEDNKAEGYVYVHAGIHNIGDVDPARYDWRNPVARITISRD